MLGRINDFTFHRSIRATLVALLLVVMVPIVLVEPFLHFQQLQEQRDQELRANLEIARVVAASVDTYVGDILRQELLIGLAGTSGSPRSGRMTRLLIAAANEHPAIGYYSWIDEHGRVVASSDVSFRDDDANQQSAFREIAAGREWVVSDLWLAREDGQPVFTVARAVRNDLGELVGVVNAMVDAQYLSDLLNMERSGQGSVMILDRTGRAVYRSPAERVSWSERALVASQPIVRSALGGAEAAGSMSLDSSGNSLAAFAPVRTIGWAAGASKPERQVVVGALAAFSREFVFYTVVGLCAFMLALWLGRSLTDPIRRLRDYAKALEGNVPWHRAEVGGPSDLRQLAGAFNSMADAVESRTKELGLMLEAVHTVAGAGDPNVALYELSSLMARAVNVPVCRVALLTAGGRKLVLRAAYSALPRDRPTFVGRTFAVDDIPPARRVLEERSPVAIEGLDSPLLTEAEKLRWQATGLQAALGVPLMARDRVIGLATLGDVRPRSFSSAEKRLCMAMARQAGVAVEKAELYQQAEQEMKRLDAVVRHASDGITLVDADRRVVTMNPAMEALVGWTAEEARDRPCREVFQARDGKGASACDTACPMLKLLRSGDAVPYAEMTYATKDGKTRQLSVSYSPVRIGSSQYAVMIARDVSKLKEVEKLKDEYVSLLSHDLRQPLAVIQGYAQVLLLNLTGKKADAGVSHKVDMILASSRRMDSMIGDLVDSARLESGRMVLRGAVVSVPDVVAEALRTMVGSAGRVRFQADAEVPPVTADAERLGRVVANLVGNALKYSPADKAVQVRVYWSADEVVTEVADEGPGIEAEELSRVFERFYRTKTAGEREGLGLGLYISRLLIEAHQGRIWAESEVGKGSTFRFALPALPSKPSEGAAVEVGFA